MFKTTDKCPLTRLPTFSAVLMDHPLYCLDNASSYTASIVAAYLNCWNSFLIDKSVCSFLWRIRRNCHDKEEHYCEPIIRRPFGYSQVKELRSSAQRQQIIRCDQETRKIGPNVPYAPFHSLLHRHKGSPAQNSRFIFRFCWHSVAYGSGNSFILSF